MNCAQIFHTTFSYVKYLTNVDNSIKEFLKLVNLILILRSE